MSEEVRPHRTLAVPSDTELLDYLEFVFGYDGPVVVIQKWDHDGRRWAAGSLNVLRMAARGGRDETVREALGDAWRNATGYRALRDSRIANGCWVHDEHEPSCWMCRGDGNRCNEGRADERHEWEGTDHCRICGAEPTAESLEYLTEIRELAAEARFEATENVRTAAIKTDRMDELMEAVRGHVLRGETSPQTNTQRSNEEGT